MVKINNKWSIIKGLIYWLVIAILASIALLSSTTLFDLPYKIRLYSVMSGSMTPAIPAGSLVITQPFSDYKKGDIITFRNLKDMTNNNPKVTITHRIYEIGFNDKKVARYVTKGDFNKDPDMETIAKEQIIGKVVLTIPYLGYPINYVKTLPGLIIFIVVPATLIVYTELISIKNEALRLIKERRYRKLSAREKVEEKIGEEIIEVEKIVKKDIKIISGKKDKKQ